MKYLILEPSVFVEISKDTLLLYNSINGKKIFHADIEVIAFFKNLKYDVNVIPIEVGLNKKIKNVIKTIEEFNFGFLAENKKVAPIQFSPVINIQNESGIGSEITDNSNNALLNIREVSLYLNGLFPNKEILGNYKQTLCNPEQASDNELDISLATKFVKPLIQANSLFKINLLGENIFKYTSIDSLLDFLKPISKEIQICYYLSLEQVIEAKDKLDLLLKFENFKFVFCINDDSYKKYLNKISTYLPIEKVEFNCLVENINDVDIYNYLPENNLNLVPIYNGINLDFFEDNVYTDKDDIDALTPNQNEVFRNVKLNSHNFGKLIILPNGNIYANINHEKLGNICSNSATEIVSKEFYNGASWFLTRDKVKPCKDCVYKNLCPSISNYELILNRYNLCYIK